MSIGERMKCTGKSCAGFVTVGGIGADSAPVDARDSWSFARVAGSEDRGEYRMMFVSLTSLFGLWGLLLDAFGDHRK